MTSHLGALGVLATSACGLAAIGWMLFLNRRDPVGHRNVVEVQEAGEAVSFPPRRKRARDGDPE